jgi:hypothetical protein
MAKINEPPLRSPLRVDRDGNVYFDRSIDWAIWLRNIYLTLNGSTSPQNQIVIDESNIVISTESDDSSEEFVTLPPVYDHAELESLDYASSGHTGFASSDLAIVMAIALG